MTLVEFLHPLKGGKQRDLVLATMYFLKRYKGRDQVTAPEIRTAMVATKLVTKSINVNQVINHGAPYVYSPGGKESGALLFELTDTGEKYVRELLDLPAAEPEIEHDVGTLSAVATKIADANARGYVEEAIKCLQVGALRAATVFLWTGVVSTLRDRVWSRGPTAINAAAKMHNPKASFTKKDDFAYMKDELLLQVAHDLSVLDKTEKGRLKEGLDLRNACGHPSSYSPGPKKVSAFIEDVVGIVFRS